MVEIRASKPSVGQARRDFYLFLSELFIGLYPDSLAASAGFVDREILPSRLQESYEEVLALTRGKGRQRLETDFTRVTKLVGEYTTVPSEARMVWLDDHKKERQYLTNQALDNLRKASKVRKSPIT